MDGIEYGSLVTIGRLSGMFKTGLASILQRSFVKSEPALTTIYFSLEMLPERLYLRDISAMLNIPVKKLMGSSSTLSDDEMQRVDNVLGQLGSRQNYYAYDKVTVKDLVTTIKSIRNNLEEDDPVLIIIDHALLLASDGQRDPKNTIDSLQEELNNIKKQGQTVILQLSQLNRGIESSERLHNSKLHYPLESDLSTSSNMYQLSDYVFVVHIPEKLNITLYGPHEIPCEDRVFLHMLKARDGETHIFSFKNDLKHNNLIDDYNYGDTIEPKPEEPVP